MKHIEEARLESDRSYRFSYLTEFMGLTAEDIKTIHGLAARLGPLVDGLVDAVYDKLHSYDATWRHFLPRQHGYEGNVAQSLQDLGTDHELIRFRKQHLAKYLVSLVSQPYDEKMVAYLDRVGKIHTPGEGSKAIGVPLVQMNALLGFVADALTQTIYGFGLEREAERQAVRAFSKLLWVQNDLINRHYAAGA